MSLDLPSRLLPLAIGCLTGAAGLIHPVPYLSHTPHHALGTSGSAALAWLHRTTAAMGTTLTIELAAPTRDEALAATRSVLAAVRAWEDRLSPWIPESEIHGLAQTPPGVPFRFSDDTFDALARVWPWVGLTDGAFDPAISGLIAAWDLHGTGRTPAPGEIETAVREGGIGRLAIDPRHRTITRLSPSVGIDPGAFGKGLALADAERRLRERGVRHALLDFGGQLVAVGAPPGESGWPVGVADPRDRHRTVAALRVRDVSVSTSSASERFVDLAGGGSAGHVLDPRSGLPVRPWGSVTVVARDAMVADILSTALFVLGPDAAMRWAEDRSDVGVLLVVSQDGMVGMRRNAALARWLES